MSLNQSLITNLMIIVMVSSFFSACSNSRLGFGKSPPNEFLILTYPPLTIPPNISLRAPTHQKAQNRTVKNLLFGVSPQIEKTLSSGERALLKRLGTSQAQPNIRKLIATDRGLAVYPQALMRKILSNK